MIILSAQHIAKSFGVNAVLRDVSLTVQQGDRIGLVGVNGCGKSTLMRILAGLDAQDGGEISLVRGLRVGYLAQQNMVTSGETVWNELQKVYEQVFAMEKKLRELEDEMAHAHTDAQRFAQLSADYDRLTQRFEEADGYSWKSMVSGVLNGLGFKPAQYDQCVDSLSGGEQTRLCLARLLLQKPDLLLLDEPTNHLDMETLQWLENYLAAYKGSVLVISHDRYFLDHVCTGIVEILMGSSEQYNGNYTRYIAQRQERFESRMRAYEIQQKEIERQQAIIARYRMFNREKSIRAAESREKALDRMEKLEKPVDERAIRFSFEARRRTGEDVLQLTEISKSFGETHLFHDSIANNIAIGKPGASRKEIIEAAKKASIHNFIQTLPNGYDTKVGELGDTLSGGEKQRIGIARAFLHDAPFLLLDEPTSNLDSLNEGIILKSLRESCDKKTVVLVSHRQSTMQVADEVYEMENGRIS